SGHGFHRVDGRRSVPPAGGLLHDRGPSGRRPAPPRGCCVALSSLAGHHQCRTDEPLALRSVGECAAHIRLSWPPSACDTPRRVLRVIPGLAVNAELPWGNVDGCAVSATLSRLPGSALCCVMSDGGETGSLLRPNHTRDG